MATLLLTFQELLARHLETIEADMMERDVAFMQMQKDRDSIEQVRQNRRVS